MSTTLFPRVGRWHRGYHVGQVDELFTAARDSYERGEIDDDEIRNAAFDMVVDGYQTAAVDAAIDRLEAAVVRRKRVSHVAESSEESWMAQAVQRATTLYPRLQRPAGERFADAHGVGYAKRDVDAVCESLIDYFESGAGISAHEVRLATFDLARGEGAYDEAVVDSFLDRAVEVLLAVE
ncbi:MAG: DivIVA domain-containing protein [Ruaniaceae bacterium]|nr:DivIVA domain-containing protein [Ruaniaceae bacterium]